VSRFASPLTRTLVLSQPPGQDFPDTLLVRRRLNAGEQYTMYSRVYRHEDSAQLALRAALIARSTCVAYLLDWSVLDDQGQKVAIAGQPPDIVEQVLLALDPDHYAEIRDAIEQHVFEMNEERAAEKKTRDGAITSPATSPSLAVAAGAMNG